MKKAELSLARRTLHLAALLLALAHEGTARGALAKMGLALQDGNVGEPRIQAGLNGSLQLGRSEDRTAHTRDGLGGALFQCHADKLRYAQITCAMVVWTGNCL